MYNIMYELIVDECSYLHADVALVAHMCSISLYYTQFYNNVCHAIGTGALTKQAR